MCSLIAVTFTVVVTYACHIFIKNRRVSWTLPPSPKAHPFIGHLLSFPSINQHVAYRDISKQLNSDIIAFSMLGQVIVVLNSIEATTDLLVKRSSIYSDRAELPMLTDERLLGWGGVTSFLRYGETWKLQRKLTQFALQSVGSEEVVAMLTKQTRVVMQRLLKRQESIWPELHWLTGANILKFVYGYQPTYPSDHMIDIIEVATSRLGSAAVAGNFYVNTVPWLKYVPAWFPGAEWKRKAIHWRGDRERMFNEPYDWTLSQMASGHETPSALRVLLDKVQHSEVGNQNVEKSDDVLRRVVGTIYAAGANTTVSSMLTFILAMVLHPEIQQKIQKELDAVVGIDRLPELYDRGALPYLDCVIKEVLRWNATTPLAVPHACMQDDIYRDYIIPKGAMVCVLI